MPADNRFTAARAPGILSPATDNVADIDVVESGIETDLPGPEQ
jgi:hypothetical protein